MNKIMFYKLIRNFIRIRQLRLLMIWTALLLPRVAFPFQNDSPVYNILQSYSCAYLQQERIFVFLNSGFYYPGENIAFKTVLFDADMIKKTDGSNFFYLQLLNSSGKIIGNYTYKLYSGESNGMINIPDTLATGLYTLKAYTRWMQNYGPDNYFRRPILIIASRNGIMLQTSSCDSIPVKFFPESGKLITGIENTVLVRVDPCQRNSIRSMRLIDDLGKEILAFVPGPSGSAVISFTPESDRQYFAITNDTAQHSQTFNLPPSTDNGYGMHVESVNDSLQIRITASREKENIRSLSMAILAGNAEESFVQALDPVSKDTSFTIPLINHTPGINQLILFGDSSVLCSRVWYRNRKKGSQKRINFPDTLKTRSNVTTSCPIDTLNYGNDILAVSLNEFNAVTDSLLFNEINYFRYFDLVSSLTNPEFLPLTDSIITENIINNCLMATPVSLPMKLALREENKPLYRKEDQGIILSGKVISDSANLPVKDATVLLSFPDTICYMNYSVTNEKGEFSFLLNDRLYNRELDIIVQGYPRNKNQVTIIQDDPFLSSSAVAASSFTHPNAVKVIRDHQNIAMAYRVFYAKQTNKLMPDLLPASNYGENFFGKSNFILMPAEYESLPDIFEIRKNLIPGLKMKIQDDYCKVTVFDDNLQLYYSSEAFVLLNNIPFPSLKNILELNSDNIERIELKNQIYYYDNYLMYGILSIRTRTPIEVESYYSYYRTSVKLMSETSVMPPAKKGYEGSLPDVRHSLYWHSDPIFPEKMNGLHFRTSDIKGKYHLKIYSGTTDGKLHVTEKLFKVL